MTLFLLTPSTSDKILASLISKDGNIIERDYKVYELYVQIMRQKRCRLALITIFGVTMPCAIERGGAEIILI